MRWKPLTLRFEKRGCEVMQIECSRSESLKGMCDRKKYCSAALLTS